MFKNRAIHSVECFESVGFLPTQVIEQMISPKGAFGKINSLDNLEWIAYARRGNTETKLKQLWKKAFIDNAEDLFEVIWANQNLRGSLFGGIINNAPDIQTAKALSQTNFTQLINTEADKLFKFIKVE